jgi:uncharacterized membrane protein
MKSRANIVGHPLHPIFVTIPVGLWSFSPVCDLVYHLGWGGDSWKSAALYCLAGGLVGTIPALITGWLDYSVVRGAEAARVAKMHLILNLLSLPIFAASIWLRLDEGPGHYSLLPVAISIFGVLVTGVSGWLGGELVSRYRISVHETAHE